MKYFICGFSGAGKSSLLKKLAMSDKYPGYRFIDLDDHIHSFWPEYPSLGELITAKGWDWFRNEERKQILSLLTDLKESKLWLAMGGGSLSEELAQELRARTDVRGFWLDVDFETCWERIRSDINRPLAQKGEEALRLLYKERSRLYSCFERVAAERAPDFLTALVR